MKKVILSVIAMLFSAQMAFASGLDDLDDIQQAIGSAIGETTANVVASANAINTSINATASAGTTGTNTGAGTNIAGAAGAGTNIAANTGTGVNNTANTGTGVNNTGTAGPATGAGLATGQQLVALNPTQLAALGIQATPLTATPNNMALVPAAGNVPLLASATNINGVFAAIPTASGNASAASIAATATAMEIADSDNFSYDDE